jgi:ribosomal protein S18 acetylase RimI-like enzyme
LAFVTAASLLKSPSDNGLQPVDLGRHLGGIASLIELCFAAELDAGARGLIREMKWLSRAGPILRLMQLAFLSQQPWNQGYVWVEDGRVVGTVSTQRAAARSATWLIANVAVHPDYRRRGIALALMRATLDMIRGQHGADAILQVDDDNLGAVTLYRDLGFQRVVTQTTWLRAAFSAPPPLERRDLYLRLREPGEWAQQYALAAQVRPEGVRWGSPLTPETFKPSALRQLGDYLAARLEEHWVVVEAPGGDPGAQPRLTGSLTLNLNAPDGDRLTLLVHPQHQGQLERPLLVRGLRRLGRRPWPARIEYNTDDEAASAALRELGFQPRRVLRWMRCVLR